MHDINRRSVICCLGAAAAGWLGASSAGAAAATEIEPELKARIKAISNVFEIGRPEPDYAYVENLRDGRGYTVTQYGFCTYADEVSAVIRDMLPDRPETPLKALLPLLPPTADGLDLGALRALPAVWRREARASQSLPAACDRVADRLFFAPALQAAAAAGITRPVGAAIFYDTWLQHGAGVDADSFAAIHKRCVESTGGVGQIGEAAFLRAFLGIRRSVLQSPANADTADGWSKSTDRVEALLGLLARNPDLIPPVHVASAENDVLIF